MPKQNNRAALNNRLARRADKTEQKRLDLLGQILEESSSASLNNGPHQLSARQALVNHMKLLELIDELRRVETIYNPKLPVRNEQSWTNFFEWIDANADSTVKLSSSLRVSLMGSQQQEGLDNHEYALFTKAPFSKGSRIFSIPRSMMLTTETASQDDDLFDFIKNDSIASAMQNVVLVLHLLNEFSKGRKSFWSSYLAILPNKILPVLTLDACALEQMLASSHIFEMLKMIRAIARQYSYFYKRLKTTKLPVDKDFTYEYYCWGVSIICSRQNEIPVSLKSSSFLPTVHALIPLLDMCNHSIYSNQSSFENDSSQLIASQDLSEGKEVTINYGCRSSGDYFIHNGFVPKEISLDAVPFTLALNTESPNYQAKMQFLKLLNMPELCRFKLIRNDKTNRHKKDPHLTMFLIVYLLDDEELRYIMESDNPVGVADKLYDYIQHDPNDENSVTQDKISEEVFAMQLKLQARINDYLSRRSTIVIALIDRAINSGKITDPHVLMLLRHERSIFESYTINFKA